MDSNERLSGPYPGLRPFEFDENHLYFGCEGQSEVLLRKLRETHLLAVVGTSGSGKSSLVRAGLLPMLYGGFMAGGACAWRVCVMRPGDDPIRNLAIALDTPNDFFATEDDDPVGSDDDEAAALRTLAVETSLRRSALGLATFVEQGRMDEGESLLIVVDQFEELFRFKKASTRARPEDEAAAFVKLLLEGAKAESGRVYVVLTMRSDFLGDCAQFRDLPEAINDGQYLIPRLTRDQLRTVVSAPAAVYGAQLTPRLVSRLLNDVGDDPDHLPTLQHALMRTWDHWANSPDAGKEIDLPHYEAIGGMTEALSRHADEAYDDLPDTASQEIAEKLFKSLTETVQEGREIRRPTRMREVAEIANATPDQVSVVVDAFRQPGRSFLMPPSDIELTPDTLVDISHESLIRGWQRLRTWVRQEADSARTFRRINDAATLYLQEEGGLWRDPQLQLAGC